MYICIYVHTYYIYKYKGKNCMGAYIVTLYTITYVHNAWMSHVARINESHHVYY